MGRVLSEKRVITGATAKLISYTYNLDGSINKLTYPGTAKIITYTYSNAGRALSAKDVGGGINYAQSATYSPQAALAGLLEGKTSSFAGITVKNSYNNRLQPVLLSAVNPSQTLLFSLCFDFHLGVSISIPLAHFRPAL